MTDGLDVDVEGEVADAEELAAERDDVVAQVRDHAGQVARQLALLRGGDYGSETFKTDAGAWTVKFEAGDLQYLKFDPKRGGDIYVVSTKHPPDPEDLATAMRDYDAFVESFAEYVDSLSGVLDDVETDFPAVASTESVVAERDRVVGDIREVCNAMAGQLHRYDGTDYGTWTTTVDGTRWELKRELDQAQYLRVDGRDGVYLLSQYEPPSAADVRAFVDDVPAFVDAFNDHVTDLEVDLAGVEF
jgi:hypothetical protein